MTSAREKLRKKNADAVVVNRPAAMGAEKSSATVLMATGDRIEMRSATKDRIGRLLVLLTESLREDAAASRKRKK